MAPKLYLIENEETDGLVKIGFAGSGDNDTVSDVVFKRVDAYAVGISHPSTVYEIFGAPVFEKYFHTFISQKRKDIQIKFKLTGRVRRAKEWFVLPINTSEIFIAAFSKVHPKNIDDVPVDDLPVFLSGALSAINWHAQRMSKAEFAEMIEREHLLSISEEIRTSSDGFGQEATESPRNLKSGTPTYTISPGALQSAGQLARLKVEMAEMGEMEASRSIIAYAAAIMISFLLLTDATIAGCLFAIFASVLYANWPSLQPHGTNLLVNLSNYLKKSVKQSRHRASQNDD